MKKHFLLTLCMIAPLALSAFDEDDFKTGVFVLNEDWYGHQNSTINMWYPDNTDDIYNPVFYRVFQYKNAGKEIGCTAQYAQIFGGKMYIMAKQQKDPGATIVGGRLTVTEASTMKFVNKMEVINPKGSDDLEGSAAGGLVSGKALGDGRGCCGVNPDKIYLGTSNGIFIYHPSTNYVTTCIEGTENPLMKGDENNIDGQGPLYQNQIGIMIRTQDYVFAIMQDKGVLVIDPVSDKILKVIEGCFSTMVQSADGNIWVGENLADPNKKNQFGIPYTHYPYGDNGSEWKGNGLLCINPYTLETRRVELTLPGAGVPQSWYAWTAGKLAASAKRNVLYFTYIDPSQGQASWFSDCKLFRYDIDKDKTEMIYDSSKEDLWFYSSSLRVSPVDDMLYAHFYVGNDIANKNWVYMRFKDENTGLVETGAAKLISNYWYPAMFVFPDNEKPRLEALPSEITLDGKAETVKLIDYVKDADTPTYSIVTRLTGNSCPDAVKAEIVKGELVLTPGEQTGSSEISVEYDSNGNTVTGYIYVNNLKPSGFTDITDQRIEYYISGDQLTVTGLAEGSRCTVTNISGVTIGSETAYNGAVTFRGLPEGLLIVRTGSAVKKIVMPR